MAFYDKVDIKVSPSGDLSLDSNKDFLLTTASGVLKQDITFRLRTNYREFIPHPEISANLDEIIGEPNNRYTAKIGEGKIINSLTQDGMVAKGDLYVKAVPLSLDKIAYYIFVQDGTDQLNVTPDIVFDMERGTINIPGA